ncbi:unnamed protein product, partial [marine sediment metagenome]
HIQWVSAQSFIDSRDILVRHIEKCQKEHKPPLPYLQQLATLDVAFVNHCEKLMGFAKDIGRKWLPKYMLKGKTDAEGLAKKTADTLCSANEFFSHGRMITGEQMKNNVNIHLEVEILSKDDPYWTMLWELYVRCEVFLSSAPGGPQPKLFESEKSSVILA